MTTRLRRCLHCLALALVMSASEAAEISVDFESFADGDTVGNTILGLSFAGATIATAGLSLNEVDFPPRSGISVVVNVDGTIAVDFAAPVFAVGAYLTYAAPVALSAYDATSTLLGSVSSVFSTNTVSGGDIGSQANELLKFASGTGITRVTFASASQGELFTLDDFHYDTEPGSPVPEPGVSLLMLVGGGALAAFVARKRGA